MWKGLLEFFKPPVFDDQNKTVMARNSFFLAIVGLTIPIILFILFILLAPENIFRIVLILIAIPVALFEIVMLHKGYVRPTILLQSGIIWITVVTTSFSTGGIHAIGFTGGTIAALLIMGIAWEWRTTVIFIVASILAAIVFIWGEQQGWIDPSRTAENPILFVAVYSSFLMVLSGLLYVTYRSITASLAQAQREVKERERAEALVRQLNEELEARIAKRTEELEKRNAESESLRETTVIVTSTLDISEAVQRILQQLKRVIVYDTASVWLYKGTTSHLVGGDGIPDLPEADKHYTVGENEPDYPLWSQGLPYVLLDDVQENYPQFREPPINYIRGWLGVPLKARGELIGIISLDSRMVGRFTHADAQLALNYANQVSIAVENARLFTDLEDELEHRQKLIDELDSTNSKLAHEIEERKRIQDKLQQLAITDPLTGLFNRRYFFEIAEKEFAKSSRYNRPLSVVILDLDMFKDINDTYGHLVGDRALIHIGRLLRKTTRDPDIPARYGGEEFVVLLPETDCASAQIFSDRLRKLVADSPIQSDNDTIHFTASIGVTGKNNNEEVETLDQLISQADQALYKAKRAGRNQVAFFHEENGKSLA